MFILEDHPVLCYPCHTLGNVCDIQKQMELLNDLNILENIDNNIEDKNILYLLRWFSLIGPKIGLPISSEFFHQASQLMLLNNSIDK